MKKINNMNLIYREPRMVEAWYENLYEQNFGGYYLKIISMIVANLALKDRVDKSEWYRGYSPLSILLRGFFNLSNVRSCWRHELQRTCSGLSELNFIKKGDGIWKK